jgi:hypothetical protein
MSEIQKPQLFDQDAQKDPNFEPVLELQENMAAAEAARRIMEQNTDSGDAKEAAPRPDHRKRNGVIISGSALMLSAALLTNGALDHDTNGKNAVPEQDAEFHNSTSMERTDFTVMAGDDLYTVAESIPGIETVDIRDAVQYIKTDPANLGPLSDGLQPGDKLSIPIEIYGSRPAPTVEK